MASASLMSIHDRDLANTAAMKHYRAKPSAQLSKYLQDDIKHAVMKLERA